MVLVRCLRDEWTVEARTCYGAAKSRADVRGCRDQLSSTQVRMMEKDLEEIGREAPAPVVVEKAPPTPIDRPPPKLVIRLFSDGSVQIDGRAIADDELDRMLTGAYMREKNTDVIIQTEPDVAHGTVIKLMERAKAAGLTRLAIGTGTGSQP
jgi:biopolymer transport protein ExbD